MKTIITLLTLSFALSASASTPPSADSIKGLIKDNLTIKKLVKAVESSSVGMTCELDTEILLTYPDVEGFATFETNAFCKQNGNNALMLKMLGHVEPDFTAEKVSVDQMQFYKSAL